jgi:hypothetical protein
MRPITINVSDHNRRTRWVRGEIRADLDDDALEEQVERIYAEASAKAFELITGQPPPPMAAGEPR